MSDNLLIIKQIALITIETFRFPQHKEFLIKLCVSTLSYESISNHLINVLEWVFSFYFVMTLIIKLELLINN